MQMFVGYEIMIIAFLYVALSEFLVYKISKSKLKAFLIMLLIFAILYYFVLPKMFMQSIILNIYSFKVTYQIYFLFSVIIFTFVFYMITKLYMLKSKSRKAKI